MHNKACWRMPPTLCLPDSVVSYNVVLCLRENVTSFTKPEVHNVLHGCQRRTEPWPQVTLYRKFYEHVVLKICEWTDRQTYRHADRKMLRPPTRGEVKMSDIEDIDAYLRRIKVEYIQWLGRSGQRRANCQSLPERYRLGHAQMAANDLIG